MPDESSNDLPGKSDRQVQGQGTGGRHRSRRDDLTTRTPHELKIPRSVNILEILHSPGTQQYNDLTENLLHDGRLYEVAPVIYRNGLRYKLADKTVADGPALDGWTREDDGIKQIPTAEANTLVLAGDRCNPKGQITPQPLETSEEGGKSFYSAVKEVNQYILPKASVDVQNLDNESMGTLVTNQTVKPVEHHRSTSGTFQSTPLAGCAEKVATAMAMSLEAAEEECTHPSIDALIMLSVERRRTGLVKWPIDPMKYPTTCEICENVIKNGEGYKRCALCGTCRCRKCEWTLKHHDYPHY